MREPLVYVDKCGLMFDNIKLQWQGYPAAAGKAISGNARLRRIRNKREGTGRPLGED